MYRIIQTLAALGLLYGLASAPALAQSIDLSSMRAVDLTHAFDRNTLDWPTSLPVSS